MFDVEFFKVRLGHHSECDESFCNFLKAGGRDVFFGSDDHVGTESALDFGEGGVHGLSFFDEFGTFVGGEIESFDIGGAHHDRAVVRVSPNYEMRLALGQDIEGFHDEVHIFADDDEGGSVEGGILIFPFVPPAVDCFALIVVRLVLVGVDNDAFEMTPFQIALNDNYGAVFLSVAKKTDVRKVLDGIKVEEVLDVGQLLAVILSELPDDGFADFCFPELFGVGVKIPLGPGGNVLGIKFARREKRRGEKGEKK